MYSNAGPVIEEPSGFFATGSVMVVLKFELSVPAAKSQPLQTIEYPRGNRNELSKTAPSVIEPGSSPPREIRASGVQVLPPRLGGSYITLWLPLLKSTGLRT